MTFNRRSFIEEVFTTKIEHFDDLAHRVCQWQASVNPVFDQFASLTQANNKEQFPFLPVSFFKTTEVCSGEFTPEAVFTSSSTSGTGQARHLVRDLSLYERSFMGAFKLFYGEPGSYIILALLPSYLERQGSSLVYMADRLIKESSHELSGFFLDNFGAVASTLDKALATGKKVLLLGVSYALLDLAEMVQLESPELIVMETGGMKGRKREILRTELHEILQASFGVETIHSEYGMTELLSQAYSRGRGEFRCPPWMKVVITDPNDPSSIMPAGRSGQINVIDLANIDSCAFLKTDDLGVLNADNSFTVLGRIDHSDLRGCSLMYV